VIEDFESGNFGLVRDDRNHNPKIHRIVYQRGNAVVRLGRLEQAAVVYLEEPLKRRAELPGRHAGGSQ